MSNRTVRKGPSTRMASAEADRRVVEALEKKGSLAGEYTKRQIRDELLRGSLSEGQFENALKRLLERGAIVCTGSRPEGRQGLPPKTYRLVRPLEHVSR